MALSRWIPARFLLILCTLLVSSSSVAQGKQDTVVVELVSGETVRGTIVERTEEYLVVDRGGGKGPFYDPKRQILTDEIKNIHSVVEWERNHARELAGAPYWRWSAATGYAALGGIALGSFMFLAASESVGGAGAILDGASVGTLVGAGSGWAIGSSADRNIAAGEPIGRGHRNAVRAGTMFIGGGVGFLVGALRISDQGDSSRDEEILMNSTAVGLAAGAMAQVLLDSKLRSPPLEPTLGVTSTGETMVVVTIRFGERRDGNGPVHPENSYRRRDMGLHDRPPWQRGCVPRLW